MEKKDLEAKLDELSELLVLLRRSVLEDRRKCLEWYEELKGRWDEDDITSEMASVEREINNALKNAITATDKVPKIMDSISKIVTALIKERALINISSGFQNNMIDMDDPSQRLKELENRVVDPKEIRELDEKVERNIQ